MKRTRKRPEPEKKPARRRRKGISVKVHIAAKNPGRKVVKRNPARRVTPLRRNPVQHWAIIALTKKQGKLWYYAGGDRFTASRRGARQFPTRADALTVARKILPRLPRSVQSLVTREIAANPKGKK